MQISKFETYILINLILILIISRPSIAGAVLQNGLSLNSQLTR